MAAKRMFAKVIIGSARFLRMSPSARLLYYDLGMQADDDGIVEAFTVMRTTDASGDDLKELESRGFVAVLNSDLVTFILDWEENNNIKKDRYHPSIYRDLLEQWRQDGSGMDTQNRLDESSIEVDGGCTTIMKQGTPSLPSISPKGGKKKAPHADEEFDQFWAAYPRKVGKKAAMKSFEKVDVPLEIILAAIEQHKKSEQWRKDNGQFIPHPATWLNNARWEDELEADQVKRSAPRKWHIATIDGEEVVVFED